MKSRLLKIQSELRINLTIMFSREISKPFIPRCIPAIREMITRENGTALYIGFL